MQQVILVRGSHRVLANSFVASLLGLLTVLGHPQLSFAGTAWDVVKYNAATGAVANDTFAFEAADPYQGTVGGYLFAGACNPYPTCYPMWNNSLSGSPGTGWAVVGAADFDLNGTVDLVYQNASTGQVSVSFFQGSYAQSFMGFASLPSPGLGWNVEAVGDLKQPINGYLDPHPDIVYFNPTTGARQVYSYTGAQGVTQLGNAAPILTPIPSAQFVAAIADINGDGQADLITQNIITANVKVNYLSYGSGTFAITGTAYMNSTGPQGWVVIGAMDADGDGYPDLFYMNTSSGEVTVNYFVGINYRTWSDVEQVNASKRLFIASRMKQPKANQPKAVMLYIGTGTTDHDYYALEREMDAMGLTYDTADWNGEAGAEIQFSTVTQAVFDAHGLFVIPGGWSSSITTPWTTATVQTVQQAVLQDGVSYLGVCAGAFVAGSNKVNLTGQPQFSFYSPFYQQINEEMVDLSLPNGSQMDTFWFDGPDLQGFGNVIAKYPDGTSAVAEQTVPNNGFMVLSGLHSEAPASWFNSYGLSMSGNPIQTDFAFAASLIDAALTKAPLPHF